ncbi:MAG: YraN family protein [Lachnospiraceae bacterium]|nr:YraN family protein [Lachnospiraceae bacterium]MDO4735195.1 YraN family protein [Lachnospiraceae bacterium]
MKEQRNKREVGTFYERMACAFIEEEGMEVIETNYRTQLGEIDIIARERETLVFIEVKYRKDRSHGGAEFAIPRKKQLTIMKVAKVYIRMNRLPLNGFYRFDAVLIDGEEIQHIKNAWQA